MHVATRLLMLATIAAPAVSVPTAPADAPSQERRLILFHTHTASVSTWFIGGTTRRFRMLSCNWTNSYAIIVQVMCITMIFLFDVLFDLTTSIGRPQPEINVILRHRTRWSNEFLRTHTPGVAKQGLHMEAEAIDIRLPGVKTSNLRDAALTLGRGGVGYHAASDFIHVDVGRVRRW